MPNAHGDFIWYELMTPDPAAAKAFYENVLPWTVEAEGNTMPNGSEYRAITAPGGYVGGVLTLTPEMVSSGARAAWFGYVAVDDADAAVAKVRSAGGQVLMEPMDMEGIGRMAMLADPSGAPFYVIRGASDEESTAYRSMKTGHVAWNEVNTSDFESARSFYHNLFGWTDGENMPMGEMGTYQMFDQHGRSIGAIMKLNGEAPPPMWLFYFAVDDIDTAHAAIHANGGQAMHEPQPIPGDMFTVSATDPQGAMFAVVGARRRAAEG